MERTQWDEDACCETVLLLVLRYFGATATTTVLTIEFANEIEDNTVEYVISGFHDACVSVKPNKKNFCPLVVDD